MVDDKRRMTDAADRFDGYLEALLGDSRPSPEAVDDNDEAEMARMAAELAASGRPASDASPDPAFIEQLRLRMRQADAGVTAIRRPPPVREQLQPDGTGRWRLSRRQLLQAGLGAAAGVAVGVIGASLRSEAQRRAGMGEDDQPLVAGEGFWTQVARLDEVPPGSAAIQHGGLRRLRRQRRRDGARAVIGLHSHGLHPPLPTGLAGSALPLPRRELRPRGPPCQRAGHLARSGGISG